MSAPTTKGPTMSRHRAEFLMPGIFMPEETVRTVPSRDPNEVAALAPAGAFCFTIWDVEDAPDLGPDFRVVPKPKNKTGRYYLGGEVFTLAQIEAMGKDFHILAANMSGNKWPLVIRCRTGNWQPFTEADAIVDLAGAVGNTGDQP